THLVIERPTFKVEILSQAGVHSRCRDTTSISGGPMMPCSTKRASSSEALGRPMIAPADWSIKYVPVSPAPTRIGGAKLVPAPARQQLFCRQWCPGPKYEGLGRDNFQSCLNRAKATPRNDWRATQHLTGGEICSQACSPCRQQSGDE